MNAAQQSSPELRICHCCSTHLGTFEEMSAWLSAGQTMKVRIRTRGGCGYHRLGRRWVDKWTTCDLTERQVEVLRKEEILEVEIIN